MACATNPLRYVGFKLAHRKQKIPSHKTLRTLLNLLCDDEARLNERIKHMRKNRCDRIYALHLVKWIFE